ncbi:MAG: WYL domain-containing protein [Bacteriovoracaceae bacterium]
MKIKELVGSYINQIQHKILEHADDKLSLSQMLSEAQRVLRAATSHKRTDTYEERLVKIFKFESAIKNKNMVQIKTQKGEKLIIYPHKIVYLDGVLSIIGESHKKKLLNYFGLQKIVDIEGCTDPIDYKPIYSQMEINEFVQQLRKINGNEVRLVLKIYGKDKVELSPPFHYLGNPFVTLNPEGDMIWAASVEPCDELFIWLSTLGGNVEILDPESFKKDFLQFCVNKYKKAA